MQGKQAVKNYRKMTYLTVEKTGRMVWMQLNTIASKVTKAMTTNQTAETVLKEEEEGEIEFHICSETGKTFQQNNC